MKLNGTPTGEPCSASRLHCLVSAQIAEAESRYIKRLESNAKMRGGLVDSLVSSMGFCVRHSEMFAGLDNSMSRWVRTCERQADVRLAELFMRTRLQDEFLQDIVFGARSRCPACAFVRRLEGRILSRLMRDFESRRASVREVFSSSLCFEYARRLWERAQPSLRSNMFRALKNKVVELVALAQSLEGQVNDREDARQVVINAILPQEANGPVRMPELGGCQANAREPCPVCAALNSANHQWIKAVADNIRLEQPMWLTLPICAPHVVQCLRSGLGLPADTLVRHYTESALAVRQIKRAVSGGKKRRKGSTGWFDANPEREAHIAAGRRVDPAAGDPAPEQIVGHFYCPGCRAQDIAMRGAISKLLNAITRVGRRRTQAMLESLCSKHLAEALIVASIKSIQDCFLPFFASKFLYDDKSIDFRSRNGAATAEEIPARSSHHNFDVSVDGAIGR